MSIAPLFFRPLTALGVSLFCLASPLSADETPSNGVISMEGQLFYRERIAPPQDGIATISLDDISIADAASVRIATLTLSGSAIPILFSMGVAKSQLDDRATYALRGTITDGAGRLFWTTDTAHIIDPELPVNDMGMMRLVRVTASSDGDAPSDVPDIKGGAWRVEDLNGTGVIDYSQTTISFDSALRMSGRAGCNNYSGSYTQDGSNLQVGEGIAVTSMACAPALANQEVLFFDILSAVHTVAIDDTGALILTDLQGRTMTAHR